MKQTLHLSWDPKDFLVLQVYLLWATQELLNLHTGHIFLVTCAHFPFTFVKNELHSPTVTFSVFEFSLKVSKASGVLVPGNLRELNNSLRIRKTHINLKKRNEKWKVIFNTIAGYSNKKTTNPEKLWKPDTALKATAEFKIRIFKGPWSTQSF